MKQHALIARVFIDPVARLGLFTLLLCALAYLASPPAQSQTSAAIQGTVTDRTTGLPIANASVYTGYSNGVIYGSPIATTDANGNYSLTGGQIGNSNTGELSFVAAGYYIPAPVAYTLSSGTTTTVSETMLPEPAGPLVQGTVTDATTGAGIVGAYVQFGVACTDTFCSTSNPISAVSGVGGSYTIANVQFYEAGIPGLQLTDEKASATGYFNQSSAASLFLTGQLPVQQNIALSPTGLTEAITIATSPPGLGITVDGNAGVSPQTFNWVPGNQHVIATSSPQTDSSNNKNYFVNWTSTAGQQLPQALSQLIVVPASSATYTATFDSSPPSITPVIAGTLGTNGWYISNVTVNWTVSDLIAPVISETGCGPTTITSDTVGQLITCSATGVAGTNSQSVTIKRDTTPPQATAIQLPVPNTNGWNDTTVTVSFTGTDTASGIAFCSAPVSITSQGANQTSPPGTCTDNAGNVSAPVTLAGINIDETTPGISDVISDSVPESASGWYTAPVTISFTGTDALSGVAANGCTSPVTLSTSGANQSVSGTCTNRAGDVAKLTVSGIKIDTIPPVATATATPAPNANGWNKTPVTVSFSGTDNLNGSGVAGCSSSVTLSANGAGQKGSGTCKDVAGNVSALATATVNIDQIPPTVTLTAPTNGATYGYGATIHAAYSCADTLSGLASCIGTVVNGAPIITSAGSHTFTVTATDLAGNASQTTIGYSVALASQTISFGVIASQMAGTTIALQASASSGLPVSYTSSPSSVCTVSGSTASLLTTGTCTITASQIGNTSYSAAKSVSQSFTVTPKLTSDTVTLGISSGTQAYSVRNRFAIGPSYTGSPVPTGTVTLYDNGTALITLTLGSNGVAYYTANPLNAGVNVMTASYSGDSHYAPGVSAPVTLNVTPAPVNLSGSCWGGTPYKVAYQCLVTVSAGTATPPTGSITYSLDGASVTAVALSSGSASFTVGTLPAGGAHKLTIAYGGQGNYAAGTTLTESFTTAPGQTQLLISPSSYYLAAGSPITLSVTASTPQSGVPTGNVTFYDNGTALGVATIGSNGVARYPVASIPKGTNAYTAKYAATANYAAATSDSAAVTAH